ncbi:diacylglycerol O-acyltransferase 2 [Hemibagrus wyckioides]|uniref:diacylglycerol O-acyltransferase 2 n=1 Tax=Hemibagrus wyckioides TaxID=337641 RepID=UPI00266D2203|nr:diacylglycerol O-acyltransferase 2 [Hemibagrus wyckioides]
MKTLLTAYSRVKKGSGSRFLSALQDLPSAPWLSKSKLVKQLQAISVLQFIITFLVMGTAATVLLLYLLCTDCWVISAVYIAWLIFDWNTPKQGGRRSAWVRNWTVWKYFRDYFPIRSNAVVIVVGGAAESLDCAPGMNSVTLRNRKGFIKLALQKGADLVPVYSYGENEAYKQVIFEEGSWWRWVQRKLQKLLGFAPCIFHGCGFFSTESWGFVPYGKPINTVVGEPITVPKMEDPTPDVVEMYHTMYVNSLTTLFNKYKTRFGLKESDILHIH